MRIARTLLLSLAMMMAAKSQVAYEQGNHTLDVWLTIGCMASVLASICLENVKDNKPFWRVDGE